MKQFLLAILLLATGHFGFGQCDKKVVLTASKTDHLAADSSVENSAEENTVIEFDKSTISISPGGRELITGTVKSYTCNWSEPYKTGRTQLKVLLTNPDDEHKNATITIEGKDGKVVLLAKLDDAPDKKIRVVADKFEEKH
ncbi:hypothetical protein [Puia sp.]|jgi:hypothetical protein|uniref:hypothetical protein n=1 Tax=Puia sp. TaxID=2045100 RepID=UPI002F3F9962